MWVAGERVALLENIKAAALLANRPHKRRAAARSCVTQGDGSISLPENTRRAVLRAVKESALSKATRLLLNNEQSLGPEAEPALRLLHPVAGPPMLPVSPQLDLEDFDADDVKRAIKTFPRGSGAGPSGLMAAHIPFGPGAEEQRLLSSLARLCSSLAYGRC